MTTTHTFQGINTASKPSSRVMNPPGGTSSNIFGSDDKLKQHSSVRSNTESVSRERIDQGLPSATASPQQQKSRPSRSAFNPITGEPYEQPKPKQETKPASQTSAENTISKTTLEGSNPAEDIELVSNSSTVTDHDALQPVPTPTFAQQKQQHQSGRLFGGGVAEDVKEHRSTRVSQPPGGRSSKLW